MNQKHKRWHMYDENNVKIIKRFPVDVSPPEPWMPGMGPHKLEVYIRVRDYMSKLHKGRIKSQEFKEYMRNIHSGVPKTDQHKRKIADSQRIRWAKKNKKITVE